MNLDQLLSAVQTGKEVVIPSGWTQGRTAFGGLVAGLVLERLQAEVVRDRPLRSMQVSFVGPVAPDTAAEIEAEILREGKSVSQAQGRIVQDGETRLVCLASFGEGRESAVSVEALPAPEARPPRDGQELPFIPGVVPEFVRHIEMRWAFGYFPFTGKGCREMGGWMRFREAPETLTDAHLVALIDAWPPAILPYLKRPAPASSLSWALEMVHPRPSLAPGDWLLYRASIDQAGAGYGHIQAGIWTAKGELVAVSRQTVTVFG